MRLNRPLGQGLRRREVLRLGLSTASVFLTAPLLSACGNDGEPLATGSPGPTRRSNIANLGPLGEPNADGVRVPAGFTARIVARSNQPVLPSSAYLWHGAPDGGATYATEDGGWIYVSNSELPTFGPVVGGAGALRFAADGTLIDAYPILSGTNINCAGGPTPWGTWLSCEEFTDGRVWECDPYGVAPAAVRPALGVFQHEAVSIDPLRHHLYLTEDVSDGCFYRFTPERLRPDGYADITAGTLAVAQVIDGDEGRVVWHTLPDPAAAAVPTRMQVAESTHFRGGEGIWYHQGIVYFTTKGDNRVWAYDTRNEMLSIFYDDDRFESPILRGVDNVVVSTDGDVLVAEDGDNMQIVALTPDGSILPVVQIDGQSRSEITGPAFDPSGDRLYFSSQRGVSGNPLGLGGITYEVSGPFFV